MIGQTRFHRGCNTQTRMNSTEVVIPEVQGNRGFQVRQLLAERVREPRKSSHRHSHGQVLPFHERRADMFGIALSDLGYNPRDPWWGVPRFGRIELPVVPEHLREFREIYFRSKVLGHGHGVVVTRGPIRVLALAKTGELRPFHCITNYWSGGRIHYGSFLVFIYANHHESAKYPFHRYGVVWFWYVLSGAWIVTPRLCHAA